MTRRSEPREDHLAHAQSEEERLHAQRDLSRAELGETLGALASKVNVTANSRNFVHTYLARTQDLGAAAGEYARRGYERWSRTKQPSPTVLTAGAVALVAVLTITKYRARARGR